MPKVNKKRKSIDPPVVMRTEQPPYTPIAIGLGRVWSHKDNAWKPGFVVERIGEYQGETNVARLTPNEARAHGYALIALANEADEIRAKARREEFGKLSLVLRKKVG